MTFFNDFVEKKIENLKKGHQMGGECTHIEHNLSSEWDIWIKHNLILKFCNAISLFLKKNS